MSSSGLHPPESQPSSVPFPAPGVSNFRLVRTRVTATWGGNHLELKLGCDPRSASDSSALGVKDSGECVCKDGRRLCRKSAGLARIEHGSSSASLGGAEMVVSDVSLGVSHFLLRMPADGLDLQWSRHWLGRLGHRFAECHGSGKIWWLLKQGTKGLDEGVQGSSRSVCGVLLFAAGRRYPLPG